MVCVSCLEIRNEKRKQTFTWFSIKVKIRSVFYFPAPTSGPQTSWILFLRNPQGTSRCYVTVLHNAMSCYITVLRHSPCYIMLHHSATSGRHGRYYGASSLHGAMSRHTVMMSQRDRMALRHAATSRCHNTILWCHVTMQ